MNIDLHPDYKAMYKFVEEKYKSSKLFGFGTYDETYFTLRVFEMCKVLISKIDMKVEESVILTAAILHDIGKTDLNLAILRKDGLNLDRTEWKKHPSKGVPIARKYLKSKGHSEQFIEKVSELIEKHDARKDKLSKRTIELEILQDADLLADHGFIGVARSFLYTGQHKVSILQNLQYILENESRVANTDKFNLQISKRMAKQLHDEEQSILTELKKDLNSELLK
jgi:HD superfamily phosphodiesterase